MFRILFIRVEWFLKKGLIAIILTDIAIAIWFVVLEGMIFNFIERNF